MVEELQPDDIAQWVHGWARLGGWSWSAVVAGCAAEDMVTPALFASPFLIRPRASSHVLPGGAAAQGGGVPGCSELEAASAPVAAVHAAMGAGWEVAAAMAVIRAHTRAPAQRGWRLGAELMAELHASE